MFKVVVSLVRESRPEGLVDMIEAGVARPAEPPVQGKEDNRKKRTTLRGGSRKLENVS